MLKLVYFSAHPYPLRKAIFEDYDTETSTSASNEGKLKAPAPPRASNEGKSKVWLCGMKSKQKV